MFVKPGTGPSPDDPAIRIALKVRDPETRRLMPAEGAHVPETSFWLCRLRDKDVVPAEPPAETAEPGAHADVAAAAEHAAPAAEAAPAAAPVPEAPPHAEPSAPASAPAQEG